MFLLYLVAFFCVKILSKGPPNGIYFKSYADKECTEESHDNFIHWFPFDECSFTVDDHVIFHQVNESSFNFRLECSNDCTVCGRELNLTFHKNECVYLDFIDIDCIIEFGPWDLKNDEFAIVIYQNVNCQGGAYYKSKMKQNQCFVDTKMFCDKSKALVIQKYEKNNCGGKVISTSMIRPEFCKMEFMKVECP